MMVVGLTGGIGSGKTTVAQMFRELGVPVYDSDKEAKRLMVTSKEVKDSIIDLFGKQAYTVDGLNRTFIAEKVFKDRELLEKLNGIVHPAVRKHFLDWAQRQESPYVIQETALIFENGAADKYNYTILITAPKQTRIQRVVERDEVGKESVRDRIQHQWEDDKKAGLADFTIENLDLKKTKEKVNLLHLKLLSLASKF